MRQVSYSVYQGANLVYIGFSTKEFYRYFQDCKANWFYRFYINGNKLKRWNYDKVTERLEQRLAKEQTLKREKQDLSQTCAYRPLRCR